MEIEVVYAEPRRQRAATYDLNETAVVADALAAAAQDALFSDVDVLTHAVGVFGRLCTPQQRLREGDRVELYRELLVDAKTARRQRALEQEREKRPGKGKK